MCETGRFFTRNNKVLSTMAIFTFYQLWLILLGKITPSACKRSSTNILGVVLDYWHNNFTHEMFKTKKMILYMFGWTGATVFYADTLETFVLESDTKWKTPCMYICGAIIKLECTILPSPHRLHKGQNVSEISRMFAVPFSVYSIYMIFTSFCCTFYLMLQEIKYFPFWSRWEWSQQM